MQFPLKNDGETNDSKCIGSNICCFFFRLNQWKANNNSMFDNIELNRDERSTDSFAYLYMFII